MSRTDHITRGTTRTMTTTTLTQQFNLGLNPLHNNIAACLCILIYFKLCIVLCMRFRMPIKRQLWLMGISGSVFFWQFFDLNDWSWRLNAIVPAAMIARLIYKGAIRKDPEDVEVQTLSISSSPSELLYGPLQMASILVYLGLYRFLHTEAALILAACVGNAIAPLVGYYGRHEYRIAARKTAEGTVFVFLGTVATIYLYLYAMQLQLLPLRVVLVYGALAAVAEATSLKSLDNVVLAVVMHFSMSKVQELLPSE